MWFKIKERTFSSNLKPFLSADSLKALIFSSSDTSGSSNAGKAISLDLRSGNLIFRFFAVNCEEMNTLEPLIEQAFKRLKRAISHSETVGKFSKASIKYLLELG